MSVERVAELNEFAREKHPGMAGVEVLTCGLDFPWAPVVVTLADWLCACGTPPNMPRSPGPGAHQATSARAAQEVGYRGRTEVPISSP